MGDKKQTQNNSKEKLHPRNKHRDRYDLDALIQVCPELENFVQPNIHGDKSINFSDAEAVVCLNKALLKKYYSIEYWELPKNNLCPPIPGRADYIHHISDFLRNYNYGKIPTGSHIKCMDIGIGANCIYPIIGTKEYGWNFIGTDINPDSISNAELIIQNNKRLQSAIELRLQPNKNDIFKSIFYPDDLIDFTICNPPFHSSSNEAQKGTKRKNNNVTSKNTDNSNLNFGGIHSELICEGGEEQFIGTMIRQSKQFKNNCYWFSSLVSKQSNLKSIEQTLKKMEVEEYKIIPMGQGNKISRIIVWTYLTKDQQKIWRESKWNKK